MVGLLGNDGFNGLDGSMKEFVAVFTQKTGTLGWLGENVAMQRTMMPSTIANLQIRDKGHYFHQTRGSTLIPRAITLELRERPPRFSTESFPSFLISFSRAWLSSVQLFARGNKSLIKENCHFCLDVVSHVAFTFQRVVTVSLFVCLSFSVSLSFSLVILWNWYFSRAWVSLNKYRCRYGSLV